MAEIKLRFDITFSRRFVTTTAAFAMMLCAVPELESESVTLSTYYPAPSGVYTNMITTGNTYLARDNGNASMVGIGITNPAVKLDVAQNGAIKVGNAFLSSGGNYMHLASNEWYDGGQWWNSALAAGALLQMSGSTLNFYTHDALLHPNHTTTMSLDGAGNLSIYAATAGGGNLAVAGNATVTGVIDGTINTVKPITSRQGTTGLCTTNMWTYGTPAGGTHIMCGAGYYATLIDGFYSKQYMIPVVPNAATNPEITARCCPCPVIGGVTTCPI